MNYLDRVYDPIEKAFWRGTSNRQLLIPNCEACLEAHWYPRPICPHCASSRISFKPSNGGGVIYSLTRLRQKGGMSKTIAYIRMDEGITLLSRIIDDEANAAIIGQRVQLAFEHQENGLDLPVFRPLSPQGQSGLNDKGTQ